MTSNISKARSALVALLISIFLLNVGLLYVGYKVRTDSQPQKLEDLRESVQNNEIEVTNEWFLTKLESFKNYAVASDKLVGFYKMLVGAIAILNTLIVILVASYLLRLIRN